MHPGRQTLMDSRTGQETRLGTGQSSGRGSPHRGGKGLWVALLSWNGSAGGCLVPAALRELLFGFCPDPGSTGIPSCPKCLPGSSSTILCGPSTVLPSGFPTVLAGLWPLSHQGGHCWYLLRSPWSEPSHDPAGKWVGLGSPGGARRQRKSTPHLSAGPSQYKARDLGNLQGPYTQRGWKATARVQGLAGHLTKPIKTRGPSSVPSPYLCPQGLWRPCLGIKLSRENQKVWHTGSKEGLALCLCVCVQIL